MAEATRGEGYIRTIELPVRVPPGGKETYETIEAVEVSPGRFRLLHSPGLVEGLAADDEIERIPEFPGYRLIKPGGNAAVWLFLPNHADHRALIAEVAPLARSLGGRLESQGFTSLIFTFPKQSAVAVQSAFEDLESRIPGSVWMFGNLSQD